MSHDDTALPTRSKRMEALRKSIRQAFPAVTVAGKITRYDNKLEDPEFDEEKELHDALRGRTWMDLPKQILQNQPDGYLLLTDDAFAAFFPAWLIYSLENIDGENEIRNFVVYSFRSKHDKIPDTTPFVQHRLRILSPEQRHTLRSLLIEFSEQEVSPFVRRLASEAVALIDSLQS